MFAKRSAILRIAVAIARAIADVMQSVSGVKQLQTGEGEVESLRRRTPMHMEGDSGEATYARLAKRGRRREGQEGEKTATLGRYVPDEKTAT